MIIFFPPLYSRKISFLLLGGLIFLLSCQSDPIVFNPSGGYEYQKKSFQLNIENSETIQGDLHTGMSPRLYSGILLNGDTVSTLIRLLPEVLDSHDVCGSDSINNVDILLTSFTPILLKEDTIIVDTLIQFMALKTYLISYDIFEEDDVLTEDIINNIKGLTYDILPNVELNTNTIALNLLAHESTIIKKWCEDKEDLGVVISYVPTDSTYLEFYSSNSYEVELGPRLFLEYSIEEETSHNYTRYIINDVSWLDEQVENMNGPYFVHDSLSGYWGTVYAMSLDKNNKIIEVPPLDFNSNVIQTDMISAGKNVPLLTIDLDLNTNILDSISSITFSILNAFAFVSAEDPGGDNFYTDFIGTENNGIYDDGELFNDYGIDNCPDEWETGNADNPCDSNLSIFNSIGTEVNEQLDWTDTNDNKLWDEGEGEEWFDVGTDGCSDIYETGGDSCSVVENPEWVIGSDPNGDNFITDPTGDDWSLANLSGTEKNGSWDFLEPYKDWGTDGLPASLSGDIDDNGTEGNGSYDIGEPFDDTGSDGVFNENEFGYNAVGTEGNNAFDGEREFLDCGEDNICNDVEGDDETDDYNIDPNGDNWNTTDLTSIGTEGNNLLDEGEEWFDWGLDGIQDSLEAFHVSSVIPIARYDNIYIFNLDEEILQPVLDIETDTVSLWISNIRKIDNNSLNIEISVQSNIALKGLQFQLYHTPFTKVDTTLETYTHSIAQFGEDKLFEDFTLLPKKNYSDEELNETLLIEYSNDLSTFLDFDSLNFFLENEEYIFSYQYSNLVLYIDSTNTDIHEDGMWVYLTHPSDSDEEETLSNPIEVTSSADSLEISMGHILRAYQSASLGSFNGLQLKADDVLYNFSKLSIKDNPRIDVMYSQ